MRSTQDLAPCLCPGLTGLVEAGVFERADDGHAAPGTFAGLARAATRRGELTATQAALLAALLGLSRVA
jgi:hypothetical protein